MAEPEPQVQGIAAPNLHPPPADQPKPQAPQQPVQPAQQVVHLNWSFVNQNFQESPMRMQKPIYFALITG